MVVSTLSDRQRRATLGVLVGAWLVMVVPMAAAQEQVDSRWAPWIGCWRAVEEIAPASGAASTQGALLCVVPLAGEAGVEMLTVVDGQVGLADLSLRDHRDDPTASSAEPGVDDL